MKKSENLPVLRFQPEWPSFLEGRGVDELESLDIVPFLTASIENGEDLRELLDTSIDALVDSDGTERITSNEKFRSKYQIMNKKI